MIPTKLSLIIESLRILSEYIIWGEKNNSSFFEIFLENKALESIISLIKKYK